MNQCTVKNHQLDLADWVKSDNFDNRPLDGIEQVNLIVIHNISLPPKQFGGGFIEQFFTNNLDKSIHPYFKKIINLQVSSHLLILRDGSVKQFVAFDKRAWHAGQSRFQGRENCNDFSIGIELEGADNIAFTEPQYQILNKIIIVLKKQYPIKNIVGHSDISPDRKTDPGSAFDWEKIQ